MEKKYSPDDLNALIVAIETEWNEELKLAKARKESANLAKKEDKTTEENEGEEEEVKPEVKEEVKPEIKPEAKPAVEEAKPEVKEEIKPENEEKPIEKDQNEVSNDEYTPEEVASLEELYAGMSRKEAEIHYNALSKILFNGESVEAKPEIENLSKEPVVDQKPENDENKEQFMKSEKEFVLVKSENDVLKNENGLLKKDLETLKLAITKYISDKVPQRKAITGIAFIGKNEETQEINLSKSEIDSKLTTKIRSSNLTSQDREAIDSYYFSGKTNVSLVKHLL